MQRHFILAIALLYTSIASGQDIASGNDILPLLGKDFEKTANWIKADSHRRFYYAEYPATFTLSKAIKIIREEKDFWTYLQAKTYCIRNFKTAVAPLIALLTDTTKVGLINTADLIIWDRLQTNELKYYGHGGIIYEDIFTVAGRCSHILNELTDENFALVHVATTLQELKIFQRLWKEWFQRL